MTRLPKLMLLPLAAAAILLTGCGTAAPSSPAVYNQCDAIHLPPKLNAVQRAHLADEIERAPADAVFPGVLGDASRVYGEVSACQGVK